MCWTHCYASSQSERSRGRPEAAAQTQRGPGIGGAARSDLPPRSRCAWVILVVASRLTSTHCYSGQGRRPRRAPRSVWRRGLRHRGAAEGWSRLECQKQAQADAVTHSCQQGPLAGGQDSPGLWLSPQPAGSYSSLTKDICAVQRLAV